MQRPSVRYARLDGGHPHDRAEDRNSGPALARGARPPRGERRRRRSRSRSRSSAAEARGATITDVDGNTFIDFAGGVGCLNVGHSHPHVVAGRAGAARASSRTPTSRSSRTRSTRRSPSACSRWRRSAGRRRRRSSTPAPRRSRTPSSSRAPTPGRHAVIGFEGAFHGRTYLSLALTSKTHPYKAGLGPFAPEVYRVPVPERVPRPDGRRGARGSPRAFSTLVAAEDVAAIVFEPVQGEGGFIPATLEFVQGLREICDEHGIVLVCDEVQSGFARTGRFFAIEHFERRARPDHGRQVDRDGDPALGRARQGGDHGRARRRRRRRHLRRQPGRPGGRGRGARRDRGGGARRALGRDRRDDARAAWRPGRPAGRRSATCAGSARCSRSSSSRATARRRPPSSPPGSSTAALERGLLLLKAGVARELHPRARAARHLGRASSTKRSTSGKTALEAAL